MGGGGVKEVFKDHGYILASNQNDLDPLPHDALQHTATCLDRGGGGDYFYEHTSIFMPFIQLSRLRW